jgi:hypothetical protein
MPLRNRKLYVSNFDNKELKCFFYSSMKEFVLYDGYRLGTKEIIWGTLSILYLCLRDANHFKSAKKDFCVSSIKLILELQS